MVSGWYLYQRRHQIWLLILNFGKFMYLILIQMRLTPRTLLWPLYGLTFRKIDLTRWMQKTFYALHTDLAVCVPELVGVVILVWFFVVLVRRRQFYAFYQKWASPMILIKASLI